MNKPKYACPKCGGTEFITQLNIYQRWHAHGDKISWSRDLHDDSVPFELSCPDCDIPPPEGWDEAVE